MRDSPLPEADGRSAAGDSVVGDSVGGSKVGHSVDPGAAEGRDAAAHLEQFLRRGRRRLTLACFGHHLVTYAILAASVSALLIVVDRLLYPGVFRLEIVSAIAGLSLVAAMVRALFLRRPRLFDTAVETDRRLAMKERVASAYFAEHPEVAAAHVRSAADSTRRGQSEWAGLVVADAGRSLLDADVRQVFPLTPRRRALWIVVPVFAAVALTFLPILDPFGLSSTAEGASHEEEMAKAIDEEKDKLKKELDRLEAKAAENTSKETQELLKRLSKYDPEAKKPNRQQPGSQEQKGDGAAKRSDAQKKGLLEIARREEILKQGLAANRFDQFDKMRKKLEGLSLKSLVATKALQAALKQGDFAKAKTELDKLTKELQQLAKKDPKQLTEKEKQRIKQLQKELARLSRQSGAFANSLSGMESLSMSSADMAKMLSNMQGMDQDLNSLAQLSQDLAALRQAMELIKQTKAQMGQLHRCANCGKKLAQGQKPGGT